MAKSATTIKILTIDIGGSHVKATLLNSEGKLLMNYEKVVTPVKASPENLIAAIKALVKNFPVYDKISVGFPGYVKDGVIKTAPNLGTAMWSNIDFRKKLQNTLGKPVKVVNDADLQGLGVVSGKGLEMVITLGTGFGTAFLLDGNLLPHLEMVITLGTGFGTAFLLDGNLLPHLEMAHHPIAKNKTYDEYIGEKAYKKAGKSAWNNRMKKILMRLKIVFNYDRLYISGGNAEKLTFKLDKNIKIVSNKDGIKGGARLWLSQK